MHEVQNNGVKETINIIQSNQETLPARIPPLSGIHLKEVMSITANDGPQFNCWFCKEQGHTVYTCTYFEIEQQRCCAYQSYALGQWKALAAEALTGPSHVRLKGIHADLFLLPLDEKRGNRRELQFSDIRHLQNM